MAPHMETGKLFTNVISKEGVNVIIQTRTNKITGTLHKRKEARLTDTLNEAEPYIALTDVVVYDEPGLRKIHQKAYMALKSSEIIWLLEA